MAHAKYPSPARTALTGTQQVMCMGWMDAVTENVLLSRWGQAPGWWGGAALGQLRRGGETWWLVLQAGTRSSGWVRPLLGEEAPLYRQPLSLDVHGNPHIWN